jgi:hypothetical protein
MVEQFYAYHSASFDKLPRDCAVGMTWGWIAARVIMRDNHSGGGMTKGLPKNFARVKQRTCCRTRTDFMQGQ